MFRVRELSSITTVHFSRVGGRSVPRTPTMEILEQSLARQGYYCRTDNFVIKHSIVSNCLLVTQNKEN